MKNSNLRPMALIAPLVVASLFAQPPSPFLKGRVVDTADNPVPGTSLTLTDDQNAVRARAQSQDDGSFLLTATTPGLYVLHAAREGFGEYQTTVQLPSGSALTIRLSPAALNQAITVSADGGYLVTQSSIATHVSAPLADIPQNIQVVNRVILDQRQDLALADAARTVSGVSRTNTGSGYLGNDFVIRGFTLDASTNVLRDGLKFGFYSFSDLAGTEEVDVLKGPASAVYGAAEPGGLINLVSKKPLEKTAVSVQFTGGNGDFYRPEFDFSGPLLRNNTLSYRLTGAYQQDFRFRDFVKGHHYFLDPALLWHLNDKTTLLVSAELVNGQATSDFGIPVVGNRVSPGPISRYYGEPWNIAEAFPRFIAYAFHRALSAQWSIENRFSYYSGGSNYLEIYPTGVANGTTVTRLFDAYRFPEKSKYSQTELAGGFRTGALRHIVLIGFEAGWRSSWSIGPVANAPSLSVVNPLYGSASRDDAFRILFNPASPGYVNSNSIASLWNQSGYVQDQIAVGRRWKFLVGGRFENFSQESNNFLSGVRYQTTDFAATPRVGAVYQPSGTTSVYFSYVRSFKPASPSSRSATGAPFLPSHGQQYEAGVKQTAFGGRMNATVSAYWLQKDNVLTPDLNNPIFNVQTGLQRSKGVDADITGRLASGWNAWAGYAFTQAEVTADHTYPVGNLLLNAPRHSGNLWTVYEVPGGYLHGLGVGGGVYVSSFKQGDLGNTFQIPGYARVDATVYYALSRGDHSNWKLALNLKNALDRQYYEAGRGAFGRPGAPFAAYSSLRFTWH